MDDSVCKSMEDCNVETGKTASIKTEPEDQDEGFTSAAASDLAPSVEITEAMIKEEEELHVRTLKEEEETKKQLEENLTEELKKQRKQRLQFLLSKSNMYADYLVKRMQEQKEELEKREEKRRKRAAKKMEKAKAAQENPKNEPNEEDKEDGNKISVTTRAVKKSPRLQNRTNLEAKKESKEMANKKGSKKRKANTMDNYLISEKCLEEAIESNKKQKLEENADVKQTTENKADASDKLKEKEQDDEDRYINGEKVDPFQPRIFTGGVLRPYQVEGYRWLSSLYENGVNGILADEMGLGKTIQCIALVSHLVELGVPGPFLVCAPLSTVPNWVSEFSRFAPTIPVVLYHGPKEERMKLRRKIKPTQIPGGTRVQPVVITSYEIAMADRKTIQTSEWKLMIVDEGHRIKNCRCKLVTELRLYRSTHRLLLTGTPLQNNLAELWSLLNFLLPEIFDDLGSFEMWFDIDYLENEANANDEIIADEQKNNVLSILHKILSPFMLRRMKRDVDLIIPPKREVLVYAPLTSKQQELYRATVDRSIRYKVEKKDEIEVDINDNKRPTRRSRVAVDYNMMCEDGTEDMPVKNKKREEKKLDKWIQDVEDHHKKLEQAKVKVQAPKTAEIKVQLRRVLTMLQKACNHPYLIEYPLNEDQTFKIDEDLVLSSGKLMLLDRMLKKLREEGHKVLIFSQMTQILDIIQDFCYLREYPYCRLDGSYSLNDRRDQIDTFNKDKDMFVFLLSTRAGGLGINLTAADTVIIFDSDWNPQCDLQAQDRCHRIGQTKPVMIYRFVTANTVDQRIVERATAKRKLEKMVIYRERFTKGCLDEQSFSRELQPINPQELKDMLEENDYDEVVKPEVIDDHDLKCLLDRSDLYRIWQNGPASPEETKFSDSHAADIKGVFKVLDCEVGSSAFVDK